jgi:hypothetical protein
LRRRQGLPGSWGTLLRTCRVLRPRGANGTRPLQFHRCCLLPKQGHGPTQRYFGAHSHGLQAGCLRFAGWVTPPPRKTRFRLLARPGRVGLVTHRVPARGFKVGFLPSYSPCPSFAWRNVYHLSPSSRAIIQDKGVLMQAREIGGESWHKNGLAMAARSGMTRR